MHNQAIQYGEGLTLLSVAIANMVAEEFSKEDIFIIAAFLSSIAANLYLIANAAIPYLLRTTGEGGEAEVGV